MILDLRNVCDMEQKNNLAANNFVSEETKNPYGFSEAEIAYLKSKWRTVNTSTTPSMLAMNTSGSKDFDRAFKNIKLEGI